MKTTDFNSPITASKLNESLSEKFGVSIDFNQYDREALENYRNLLRTKISQFESNSKTADRLNSETLSRDQMILNVLNTRIKEMVGEKAKSKAQQKLMGMVDAEQKGALKHASKTVKKLAKGMSKKSVKDYASTKTKNLPKHVKESGLSSYHMNTPRHPLEVFKNECEIIGCEPDESQLGRLVSYAKKNLSPEELVKAVNVARAAGIDSFEDALVNGAYQSTSRGGVEESQDHEDPADGGHKFRMGKCAICGQLVDNSDETCPGDSGADEDAEMNESVIMETPEDSARVITACTDMVDDFTTWMGRIASYQTKTMVELMDSIRANFGDELAMHFRDKVTPALASAQTAITATREQLSLAVGILTGEESVTEPMGAKEPSTGDQVPAEIPGEEPTDDFSASDAAAGELDNMGRARRESLELEEIVLNEYDTSGNFYKVHVSYDDPTGKGRTSARFKVRAATSIGAKSAALLDAKKKGMKNAMAHKVHADTAAVHENFHNGMSLMTSLLGKK